MSVVVKVTILSKSQTLNPEPFTLNFQPRTLNPTLSTLCVNRAPKTSIWTIQFWRICTMGRQKSVSAGTNRGGVHVKVERYTAMEAAITHIGKSGRQVLPISEDFRGQRSVCTPTWEFWSMWLIPEMLWQARLPTWWFYRKECPRVVHSLSCYLSRIFGMKTFYWPTLRQISGRDRLGSLSCTPPPPWTGIPSLAPVSHQGFWRRYNTISVRLPHVIPESCLSNSRKKSI